MAGEYADEITFCCAFANLRADSKRIQCVYTTKYLKQRSKERENYATLLRSNSPPRHYSILSPICYVCLPSAPSGGDPDRSRSSTDNNLRSQRDTIRYRKQDHLTHRPHKWGRRTLVSRERGERGWPIRIGAP